MDLFLRSLANYIVPNWEILTVLGFFFLVAVMFFVRMPSDRSRWIPRIRKTFGWIFLASIPNGAVFGVSIHYLMPNNAAMQRVSMFFIFLIGIPAIITAGYIVGLLGQKAYLDSAFGDQEGKNDNRIN